MRLIPKTAFALLVAAGLASPMAADTDQVWFYNWGAYINPVTIDSFQAETGTSFTMDTYGEADEAEARLIARGTGYDLAVVSMETVGRMVEAGAIQEIEVSAIPNARGMDQQLLEVFLGSMPSAKGYVLPYLWGTTGVVYDVAAVSERIPDAPTDSWALVFDPKNAERLADCGITIVDSVEEVLAAALVYLGLDPHSQSDLDIDAAMKVISAIAPYVRSFNSNQNDDLTSGEICLAIAWSTDGLAPLLGDDSEQYRYILPKEGTNLWADVFVVPSDAANVEQSNQLMDYILRPDMMALSTQFTLANNAVPASRAEIVDPNFDLPVLAFPQDIPVPLYFVKPRDGHEKRVLDRRWRRLQIGL
jgi:putrescine transport system substrate-binding protein